MFARPLKTQAHLMTEHMSQGFAMTVPMRPYQNDAVAEASKADNGGILCLPCGAGKTMIAIQIAARRNGDALIFCNTTEVVLQVVRHLQQFTDLEDHQIMRLTATHKSRILKTNEKPIVMVTTYAMMAGQNGRTEHTRRCMNVIMTHRWRTIVLDEVHCAAATASSDCWRRILADARYGLTATLVRADNGVKNLLHEVGPRLYEMQWRELEDTGFTARVLPVVVFCDVPAELSRLNDRVRALVDIMNSSKIAACDAIVAKHTAMDEKIIVFCDKLWPCQKLAVRYMCPFITGDTPDDERQEMLSSFRNGRYSMIVLSRVGDTGWDLDASVAIVVDAHFGSERQEAQRFGRIMRPNRNGDASTFYDLVSKTGNRVECFWRRNKFLSELGYKFKKVDAKAISQFLGLQHVAPRFDYESCLGDIKTHDVEVTSKAEQSAHNAEMKSARRKEAAAVKRAHPVFKKRVKDNFKKRWSVNP